MKMIKCLAMTAVAAFSLLFLTSQGPQVLVAADEQCGTQANGALCPVGYCCSQYGYCGTTDAYCVDGCQSQCTGGGGGSGGGNDLSNLITKDMFEKMLPKRDNYQCLAVGFYKYEDFIEAAEAFEGFGTTGDNETRKREIAAFFGQTSHQTNGGWPAAEGGPYAWGYCYKEGPKQIDFCVPIAQWPCAPGQQYYYGRGPIQLSYNYNYGPAGDALGLPLLANPDLVATNGVISFKTAIWFWMTPQSPKPSCHSVMTGSWEPSSADVAAGRVPGYGMTTNIISGFLECGIIPTPDSVNNRIGYYKTFCDMYNITYGDNLDCSNQGPYGNILLNTM